MAIVKSEAPCTDNARNNTLPEIDRQKGANLQNQPLAISMQFQYFHVFSVLSYPAFQCQSFLPVKKQLADLRAGQANGGGPFLLVLRADESAQALRGRVVEESLQDSFAYPSCHQYKAEPLSRYSKCPNTQVKSLWLAGTPGI